ncbi:MAG: PD40 domain-containing protein [Armatimonadetes bacterium]|nr:PD40 domain-containing protein [Armatimonadota bacterium]
MVSMRNVFVLGGLVALPVLLVGCGGSAPSSFEVLHGRIAFASDRSGNMEIYHMTTYGLDVLKVTSDPGIDTEPRWSKDGKKLAFASNRTGDWEIFLVNKDGTGLMNLTNDPASDDRCPAWSDDGLKIAYQRTAAGNSDIYTVTVADLAKSALTSGAAQDTEPNWSRFSHKITFASDRSGGKQVFLMNDDGSNIHQLVGTGSACDYPVFAPNESLIAFIMGKQLWTVKPDGTGLTQITDLPGDNTYPIWDPTSRYLLYDTDRDGNWNIYIVGLTGSYLVPVSIDPSNDIRGDWTL